MAEGGALYDWLIDSVQQLDFTTTDSVRQWLVDVRQVTDTECMCVLQGKSLMKETTDLVFSASKTIRDHIEIIHSSHELINSEILKLLRSIEAEKWQKVELTSSAIFSRIHTLLHNCQINLPNPPQNISQLQQIAQQNCMQSRLLLTSDSETNGQMSKKQKLSQLLNSLSQSLEQLVDETLITLIKRLISDNLTFDRVSNNRQTPSIQLMLTALGELIAISLQSQHLCYIIAKSDAVSCLLNLCRRDDLSILHGQALRALATVCCISYSLEQLDQLGGIWCLTEILTNSAISEKVRSEAAGVVAQITSPCLAQCQPMSGFIENMADLVQSLTVLCRESSSHEVFLLACAALANMTLIDSLTCDFITQFNTSSVLVEACFANKAQSLFAKDQVLTVFASLGSVESSCVELVKDDRVAELLVLFLHEKPRSAATSTELAACERVQQKSAVAITRMSNSREVALLFVELHCIQRLVELCKSPVQRNHSDVVLMASLAALRKIYSVCGASVVQVEEATQLVESNMMDSYLLCTSAHESFI